MTLSRENNSGVEQLDAGDAVSVTSEQLPFVPCPSMRWSTDHTHMHTCTLDADHDEDHPEDGHACPCGWFWHD